MALNQVKSLYGKEVVHLYRRVCREIPRVINVFDLDMTEREVRKKVRRLFDKNANVTDPRMVAMLLEKGEMDFQETVEQWKQKSQLHRLLGHDERSKIVLPEHQHESKFLQDFYAGHV